MNFLPDGLDTRLIERYGNAKVTLLPFSMYSS